MTTPDLITAALARGLRAKLPVEWFVVLCPSCAEAHEIYADKTPHVAQSYQAMCYAGKHDNDRKQYVFCGPDLTLERNLHELLRFAGTVFEEYETWMQLGKFGFKGWDETRFDYFAKTGKSHTAATLAACTAALNIKGDAS